MYVLFDKNLVVKVVSDTKVATSSLEQRLVSGNVNWENLVGKRLPNSLMLPTDYRRKDTKDLRVAFVCNWADKCGISTYSDYLVKAMVSQVASIKVFSEIDGDHYDTREDGFEVDRCWHRGENLLHLADKIKAWGPDLIIMQHEYGIFPNAFHFMQFMQSIKDIPSAVCMHSVYRHLDKLVYSDVIPNIIVHTEQAKSTLSELGNTSNVFIVPHGCAQPDDKSEIWNIMSSPYTLMQFGFGFRYKGVDRVLRAVSHLVHTDPKFKNLYYFYLCSTNSHNNIANQEYTDYLLNLADELKIRENISIVVKYQTDKMLNLYLRMAKIIVFPYIVNGDNMVYGSSGAVRLAMAAGRPVICSESHLFDDLEGVLPRPSNDLELAREIDEIFSNDAHRNGILDRSSEYVQSNSWENTAKKYLDVYNQIVDKS